MTDFVWLKAEIVKPAYAALANDEEIAAAINAQFFDDNQDIRPQDAREEMLFTTSRDWGELVGVVNGTITANAATKKAANSVYELFRTGAEMFDATTTQKWNRFNAMLDDLITANIITAASKTAIATLRIISRPLWYKFGRTVDSSDVTAARNMTLAQAQALRAAGG